MGRSRLAAIGIAALCVIALAGCAPSRPMPVPVPTTVSSSSSTPAPTESAAPTLISGGSAQQNKPYFDLVNTRLISSNGSATGQQLVDNLAQAGFDKSVMQVTPDKTTIGRSADSVLFSVRIGGDCLLGQLSHDGLYVSTRC